MLSSVTGHLKAYTMICPVTLDSMQYQVAFALLLDNKGAKGAGGVAVPQIASLHSILMSFQTREL